MGFIRQGLYYRTSEEARKETENRLKDAIEYLQVLDPVVHAQQIKECLAVISQSQEALSK
jgi:hypothetical protein